MNSIFNLYGDEGNREISVMFYGILFLVTSYTAITTHKSPQAMDVYQGKTTLEYKVVDGVKVDSVVIFKNEDYEMIPIEQKDIVNKLSDLLSKITNKKVDIDGDWLSSNMKVTIEE